MQRYCSSESVDSSQSLVSTLLSLSSLVSSEESRRLSNYGRGGRVWRTGLPYSCQPLDLWIETTMNLNSKLKQGWLQLLLNEKQLFTTTRNANNVARVKNTMNRNLNCQHRHKKHGECQPSRMKKDEQAVQDVPAGMHERF